jgi:hypothetical protein
MFKATFIYRIVSPIEATWASRIAPLHTLSGKHTPPASWSRAWKKAPWMAHLSGLTYSPSTVQLGVEQWIASLRDSRAKTYPLQENGRGLTVPAAASSSTSSTLPTLAVRGSSFWRTSQASLLPPPPLWTKPKGLSKSARPPESWENWPTAGGMRNGSLFQRQTWAPAMGVLGGSAGLGDNWTTPQAHDVTERGSGQQPTAAAGNACLARDARLWATPTSSDNSNRTTQIAPSHGVTHGLVLAGQAASWPTPMATDSEQAGSANANHLTLHRAGTQWPTPAARDYRSESGGGGAL